MPCIWLYTLLKVCWLSHVFVIAHDDYSLQTSIVHSKLDYCNSLYYNLPKCQISHLWLIQNSLARAVVKAPKSCHITPILWSLHWLRDSERTEYNLLSLTDKTLSTTQPPYLHSLISVQPPCSTRSSLALVTLARPPTSLSLRITDRSFRYASPHLWNELPASVRESPNNTQRLSNKPISSVDSLSPSIHNPRRCFTPDSKHTFPISPFPVKQFPSSWTDFTDFGRYQIHWAWTLFCFCCNFFPFTFFSFMCYIKLAHSHFFEHKIISFFISLKRLNLE